MGWNGLLGLVGIAPPTSCGATRAAAWQIEITTRCPLSCRMCIRQGPDRWRNADMRLEQFEKLVPHLRHVDTVVLQGWGEPLLHEQLVDIVRLAKGARRDVSGPVGGGPSVGFVTSGKGLDRQYATELVGAGLDFIGLSLAGVAPATHSAIRVHSTLEEVMSAAEHIEAAKRRAGRQQPRVHVVFLMLKDNIGEVTELPSLARRMGAEEIVLTNLIHVVDTWQDEQKVFAPEVSSVYEAILAETEDRARACHVALRRASLSPSHPAVCEEDPLRNLYVSVDGVVSPCVYLGPPVSQEFTRRFLGREHRVQRVCFGNAFREPASAIWDGPAYASFRAHFVRRAQRHRLLCFVPPSWRGRPGGDDVLPDPPDPCRTCHKLLGV